MVKLLTAFWFKNNITRIQITLLFFVF